MDTSTALIWSRKRGQGKTGLGLVVPVKWG
jgi:hypothetical protein